MVVAVLFAAKATGNIMQVVTCSDPGDPNKLHIFLGNNRAVQNSAITGSLHVKAPNQVITTGAVDLALPQIGGGLTTILTSLSLTDTQAELVRVSAGLVTADSLCQVHGPYPSPAPAPVSTNGIWAAAHTDPSADAKCYPAASLRGWCVCRFTKLAASSALILDGF